MILNFIKLLSLLGDQIWIALLFLRIAHSLTGAPESNGMCERIGRGRMIHNGIIIFQDGKNRLCEDSQAHIYVTVLCIEFRWDNDLPSCEHKCATEGSKSPEFWNVCLNFNSVSTSLELFWLSLSNLICPVWNFVLKSNLYSRKE